MTIQHAVTVFESDPPKSAAVRVLLLEAAYAADRRGVIRHSQSELAVRCCLSRPTVARIIGQLEDAGVLVRQGHGRYCFNAEALESEDVKGITGTREPRATKARMRAIQVETKRLREVMQPGQEIRYTKDFWPILTGPNGKPLRMEAHDQPHTNGAH